MNTTDKLIKHFGGKDEAIAGLGINPETWRLWVVRGVPVGKALFVEEKTNGVVKGESVLADARAAA